MKRIALVLVLFAIKQIKGQTNHYYPFPNLNAVWSESYSAYPGNAPPEICSWYQYTIGGDTIIGSNTYVKVYKSGLFGSYQCPTPPGQNPSGGTFDSSYVGGLMQDSIAKKVYFKYAGTVSTATATLLYDFSLVVGDSINYQPYAKISSIDSVLVGMEYRKRFNLSGVSGIYSGAAIIEGVGGTFGLLESPYRAEAASWGLGCFKYYSNVYPSTIASCPLITRSSIGISKSINPNKLAIYPNPANDNFTIELNSSDNQTVQIFDVSGKLVLNQRINGKADIDVSGLHEGVYYISSANAISVVKTRLVIVR